MPSYLNEIAERLLELHPGIPDINVSKELTESFYTAMRKQLIKEGILHIENIGKLEIKRYNGSKGKRDPKTGISYKVPPRNVIKYTASKNLVGIINIDRPAREKIK